MLFEGGHQDCKHSKHMARVLDYTFVFCKDTKAPIAIYCGAEVVEDADVKTLVAELAEKYSLIGERLVPLTSPFFNELGKSLLSVEKIDIVTG